MVPCASIHARTSSALHAVTLADNLTGLGNVPCLTLRHRVVAEKPIIGIKADCLTNPSAGIVCCAGALFVAIP